MTSDRPTGDATRPDTADAEDWWGPVPPSADPSRAAAGHSGSSDGRGSVGRSRWLLAAVAAAVVVAVGIGALVTRDNGGSDLATGGNSSDPGGRGGPGGPGGPGGFGGGTGGVIAEVDADASTLVVETSDGETVEVTATEDTTMSETVEGSADDLAVGDRILVVGSESDDGTIAAEQVVAGGDGELLGGAGPPGGASSPEGGFPDGAPSGGGEPPEGFDPGQRPGQGGGPGGFTTGTIAAIDGGSLSVQAADDETVTVTLSSSTTVLLAQALSFGDLATGDEITVTGRGEDDGAAVEAVVIRRGDGGFGSGGGMPPSGGDGGDDAGSGSST